MANSLRYGLLLLALALMATSLLALEFNVSVTNNARTRMPGTRVEVLVGSTVLYNQTTKWCPKVDIAAGCPEIQDRAMAQFNLAPGTYFLRVRRSSYPDQVYLKTLDEDTGFMATIIQHKSTYLVYGQVGSGSGDWSGQTIKLMDENDAVVRSVGIKGSGYYIIDSLWPGKRYYLRIDRGAERLLSAPFSYQEVGAYYVSPGTAQQPLSNATTTPQLAAPAQAQRGERIAISLMMGIRPMAGQSILASTPDGLLNISTDENGLAYLQAAEWGAYRFEWNGLSQTVMVPEPAQAPEQPAAAPAESNVSPSAGPSEAPGSAAPSSNAAAGIAISGAVIFLAAALAVIAALWVFGPGIWRRMKENAAMPRSPPHAAEERPAQYSAGSFWEPRMPPHGGAHAHGKHAAHRKKAAHHKKAGHKKK